MKEKPFISIIIPAYNAETTLKRCVRSVLIQDYEEYEIIVVDDGSKDEESLKKLEEIERSFLYNSSIGNSKKEG